MAADVAGPVLQNFWQKVLRDPEGKEIAAW